MEKRKFIFSFIISVVLLLTSSKNLYAQQKASGSSAVLIDVSSLNVKDDGRVRVLKKFLAQHDSPLEPYAKNFVETADKYNLDWKLVVSIAGLESTYGQQIPYGSYNAWGWGIYGNNVIYFKSWDDGIETVSSGLRQRYIDAWGAEDIYQIGSMYAASPTWAQRVAANMYTIEQFKLRNPAEVLSISI